ncbi:MAG: V-type ATP synthase subunit E [Thermoplasmatota archaeon]
MGLEKIIKKIDEEASREAEAIISEAETEAGRIRSDAKSEMDRDISEMERSMMREAENLRNIYISDGKRKSRQAILSAKEELIWDTISDVRRRMGELEGEALSSCLVPILEKASNTLGKGMIIYPVRERDAEVLSNRARIGGIIEKGGAGLPTIERYKGHDLIGGFIASSESGDRIIDMTFAGILSRDEDRMREIIAKTLFGENMRE